MLDLVTFCSNARKPLVPGNHDCVSSVENERRRDRFRGEDLAVFDEILPEVVEHRISRHDVLLSHYPYIGEPLEGRPDRHVGLRPVDQGVPLIHGHTHAAPAGRTTATLSR